MIPNGAFIYVPEPVAGKATVLWSVIRPWSVIRTQGLWPYPGQQFILVALAAFFSRQGPDALALSTRGKYTAGPSKVSKSPVDWTSGSAAYNPTSTSHSQKDFLLTCSHSFTPLWSQTKEEDMVSEVPYFILGSFEKGREELLCK